MYKIRDVFFMFFMSYCCVCHVLTSCKEAKNDRIISLLQEWNGKEILFPQTLVFTIQGKDTINFPMLNGYKIITYADSMECTSCRLQLHRWKELMNIVDSMQNDSVQFLFFFSNKKIKEVRQELERADFNHPVCIDGQDSLNILNKFPTDVSFQIFLLDKNSKVVAIGNPVHNPKIKDLYLKIIQGEKIGRKDISKKIQTEVSIDKTSFSFGKFDWKEEQKITFTLKNVGNKPLFIQEVTTSCGCTTVTYSKEPVRPGKETIFEVGYKAEEPGYFNKTITVYCNAKISPLTLKISGNANETKKKI